MSGHLSTALGVVLLGAAVVSADDFVNWESPHVHALTLTPDGSRLLAVNTPDNRLEVFDVSGGVPVGVGSVAVGLDPVSVRALNDQTAWVVNHVSDSVSIVDLTTLNVVMTLRTGDEPADVVFAHGKAFVSVSQENRIEVFSLANLGAAPTIVAIKGEDPRALATDGTRVYAAIFESGNLTTSIAGEVVGTPVNPYPGDPSPPPNDGLGFDPPINLNNPGAPETALIVRRNGNDQWMDDNGGDWSPAVTWDLVDHDVAVIDAANLGVTYQGSLMNLDMALSVRPDGMVTVVGTEAINEVRFEPNVNGIFVRVKLATFDPGNLGAASVVDLNPHLDYSTPTVPQGVRDLSVGDPRAIVWGSGVGYVAGMGSNNVVAIDGNGGRLGEIEVGEGPTGLALDELGGLLYVMDKFESAISVIDTVSGTETARVSFHDPSPAAIKAGRKHLYDTHETSGLGQSSCASCHVDGRTDGIAWDLGNPAGAMKAFNQTCFFDLSEECEDWHPMKGPMMTQMLLGIAGTDPLHWRGDREDLAAFNPAFESLLGDDEQLTFQEGLEFDAFVATLTPAPNPYRTMDNGFAMDVEGGDPFFGKILFTEFFFVPSLKCSSCHDGPDGTIPDIMPHDLILDAQSIKVPQLRNMYEKTGFDHDSFENTRGFGFTHDGSVDTLKSFLESPFFMFDAGDAGEMQRTDLVAFLLSFSTDTHAGVGSQLTVASTEDVMDNAALIDQMEFLAGTNQVGLVVKGSIEGEARGYMYTGGGIVQGDREDDLTALDDLLAQAAPGAELTLTLVPEGAETRIGVDRDRDGWLDRDEIDVCSNPADGSLYPGSPGSIDVNADLNVNILDFVALQQAFVGGDAKGDFNQDGMLNILDFVHYQVAFVGCSQ